MAKDIDEDLDDDVEGGASKKGKGKKGKKEKKPKPSKKEKPKKDKGKKGKKGKNDAKGKKGGKGEPEDGVEQDSKKGSKAAKPKKDKKPKKEKANKKPKVVSDVEEEFDELEAIGDSKKAKVSEKIKKTTGFLIPIFIIILIILAIILGRTVYLNTIPDFVDINSSTGETVLRPGKPVSTYVKATGNTLYEYTQINGSQYNKTMFLAYSDADSIQTTVYSPGVSDNWYTEIYQMKDGELRRTFYDTNFEQNINLLDYNPQATSVVLLKEPLVVGNGWKYGIGEAECVITGEDVEVKTQDGLFKTIEVSTDMKNGNYQKDYYSESLGLIKTVYSNANGTKIEVVLTKKAPISGGLDRAMYVYYLNADGFNGESTLVQFKQPTNKNMESVFEEILKTTTDENLKPLISPYTKINFIKLEPNLKYIHVDFSKEFKAYTSKNKAVETKHLVALANTFCRYYRTTHFKITIDGEPYTSSNYTMSENDSIKATFK